MNATLKEYLTYTSDNDLFPNNEDYLIWLVENKEKEITYEIPKGERGIIYIYAKRFLLGKAGAGGRNSQNYLLLLKELKQEEQVATQQPIVINMENKSGINLKALTQTKEKDNETTKKD